MGIVMLTDEEYHEALHSVGISELKDYIPVNTEVDLRYLLNIYKAIKPAIVFHGDKEIGNLVDCRLSKHNLQMSTYTYLQFDAFNMRLSCQPNHVDNWKNYPLCHTGYVFKPSNPLLKIVCNIGSKDFIIDIASSIQTFEFKSINNKIFADVLFTIDSIKINMTMAIVDHIEKYNSDEMICDIRKDISAVRSTLQKLANTLNDIERKLK